MLSLRELDMGIFSKSRSAPSADNQPQVRSVDPLMSDPSTALSIPSRLSPARAVGSSEALSLTAVYRATQLISTSLMQLSLDAHRSGVQMVPRPLVLSRPDVNETLSAFLEMTTLSLALNGNAFWRVFRDGQGRVSGMRVMNPHDVAVKVDVDGNITSYDWKDRSYTPRVEMQHLKLTRVPGDARGRGPIQAAQADLRTGLDLQSYSANWFEDSIVPSGILNSKAHLNGDQAGQARTAWDNTQGGKRGTAVLSGDWSYQPVYLNPEDAQFIQNQQFSTTTIARLFGVPAGLMLAAVEGTSMTYSNLSQVDSSFVKYTLMRYIVEIESALSDLLPRGTEVKFNVEALLRPDVISRYAMHEQALRAGFLTKDEVRDIENMAALPDGLGEAQAPVVEVPAVEEEEAENV